MVSVVSDLCLFCFKQKTASEMRISDWSSDVCSSDLLDRAGAGGADRDDAGQPPRPGHAIQVIGFPCEIWTVPRDRQHRRPARRASGPRPDRVQPVEGGAVAGDGDAGGRVWKPRAGQCGGAGADAGDRGLQRRSEEHTSELQSLMRISYAVFCLKKKKTT